MTGITKMHGTMNIKNYCITIVVWETKFLASIEQDVNTPVFRGLEVC